MFNYPQAKPTLGNLNEIFNFQLKQEASLQSNDNYLLSSLSPKPKKQRVRGRLSPVLQTILHIKLYCVYF